LIVQGTPADLDTVEQLLTFLDRDEVPDANVLSKPRLIPVQNSSAESMAEIIRDVFSEKITGSRGGSSSQRQPSPEEFIRLLQGGRGGSSSSRRTQESQQKMTIGVDPRTNSLVVAAPYALYLEVKEMVEMLDNPMTESQSTVRVVTLKRSNPATIQKALSALAGGENVRTESRSSSSAGGDSGDRSSTSSGFSNSDFGRMMMERMRSSGGDSGRSSSGSPFGGGFRGGDSGGSSGFRGFGGGDSSGRPTFMFRGGDSGGSSGSSFRGGDSGRGRN
jgi:type II secretory pathway component GspD/PulD (secretin)